MGSGKHEWLVRGRRIGKAGRQAGRQAGRRVILCLYCGGWGSRSLEGRVERRGGGWENTLIGANVGPYILIDFVYSQSKQTINIPKYI
jgi:hypothetical protein